MLITLSFDLITIPVSYTKRWGHRLKMKLGLSAYDAYQPKDYILLLKKNLDDTDINIVFLNLTNTIQFAEFIKRNWSHVKVVLCSHGNESGDHLHDISLHNNYKGILRKTAIFSLGNMLVKESYFRNYVDLVLTVSHVEVGIEKWLGTKNVLMIPRKIDFNSLEKNPVIGRVGFLADLSHEPNFFGIRKVCEHINKMEASTIAIHLVGGGTQRGLQLTHQYPFVKYLGYLNDADLHSELATWSFALNPVFYYSRGVSTKLGKVLSLGLPTITTQIGMRGYEWKEGELPVCENVEEMALLIATLAVNPVEIKKYEMEVKKIQSSSVSLSDTSIKMWDILKQS